MASERLKQNVVVAVALCALIPLTCYALQVFAFSRFCDRIAPADRVIVADGANGVTITGGKVTEIVQAITSARRDTGCYAANFSMVAKFYRGTNWLGEVRICHDLLLADGRQYHTRRDVLYNLLIVPYKQAGGRSAESNPK